MLKFYGFSFGLNPGLRVLRTVAHGEAGMVTLLERRQTVAC